MKIENSICVVTGGASGLGLATVEMLVSNGAKVAIWDLNPPSKIPNTIFCKVNISDTPSIETALAQTLAEFSQINVLVNCAGVPCAHRVVTNKGIMHPIEAFREIMNINVSGTFDVSRFVAKQMSTQAVGETGERGVILNVASIAGYEGQQGQVAYAASKAAIIGMSLPMARDLAYFKIRVATVAPGTFETNMGAMIMPYYRENLIKETPLKRFGEPKEFAHAAKFVIENGYMTGSTIRLDGGLLNPHI